MATETATAAPPASFLPRLVVDDPLANHWLRQVTIRLRREICWLWLERGDLPPENARSALLPPFTERLASVLDLVRYADQKHQFFKSDTTAAYLSNLLKEPAPAVPFARRGSFSWVVQTLALAPVECFVFALALAPAFDSPIGTVLAACQNDPAKGVPTLALAQRLWEQPAQLLAFADLHHPLFSLGLLVIQPPADGHHLWDHSLTVPAHFVRPLLFPIDAPLPRELQTVSVGDFVATPEMRFAAANLAARQPDSLRVVPLLGVHGTDFYEAAAAIADLAGMTLLAFPANERRTEASLAPCLTLVWLLGKAILTFAESLDGCSAESPPGATIRLPLGQLPITLFLAVTDRAVLRHLSGGMIAPALAIPQLTFDQRLELWMRELPHPGEDKKLRTSLEECARRFRYEKATIRGLCQNLRALNRDLSPADLVSACRADIQLSDLAQPVTLRFTIDELVLPTKQSKQIREIIRGMENLTRVHHQWGTARAWNESGLTALFAGPPGTGKTMAAEAIAAALQLPLFRIDLSQVVNKYIGETEKNIRRIFDAADDSDVILLFDEAEAIFGKRTEVKDAHDRYANQEVSYLLERMERFKGLAILATNRKKDLDEAFARRLRFSVDFPLPGPEERLRIWNLVIPPGVDASDVDLPFLAGRFAIAGGYIRAAVFHACLQEASESKEKRLSMGAVIRAVHHEFEKLDRTTSLEQFGPYARYLEEPA
jgi:hypothetical protein